jgi:hypothetical protein
MTLRTAPAGALALSLAVVWGLGSGCSRGWDGPDDCAALSPGPSADECWAAHAPEVFRTDPAKGEAIVSQQVQDAQIRDFIYLTVTREVDPSSYRYCDKIQESAIEQRCRVLVSRPHLHRELMKGSEGAEGAAGGGPPPGAGGGPPPGAGGPPPPGGGPPPRGKAAPGGAPPAGGAPPPPG